MLEFLQEYVKFYLNSAFVGLIKCDLVVFGQIVNISVVLLQKHNGMTHTKRKNTNLTLVMTYFSPTS